MPVTIDTSFDLSNNNIKDFLVDESIEELALFDHTLQRTGPVATAPADYIHDPEQDVRNSDSPNTTYYEFLVEETYRVYQAQGVIGRVRATVKSLAELTIYSDFLMFLRSTLNEASRAHARALFAN